MRKTYLFLMLLICMIPVQTFGQALSISIIWDPVIDTDDGTPITSTVYYVVYRATVPDLSDGKIVAITKGLEYSESGLQKRKTYYYYLACFTADNANRSELSPPLVHGTFPPYK